MNLKDILAVSREPGLFKLKANRTNGLVVEEFGTKKTRFFSARKHQFTPLESISIYTYDDAEELSKVFAKIGELYSIENLPDQKGDSDELKSHFRKVLPDFDEDRVMVSDIKKVFKWFGFLKLSGFDFEDEEE